MLTTITAPPRNIVQAGARIASNPAAMSHAHTNAKVAITGRASCDTLGLPTATASARKITTSAQTLNRPIHEVIVAAPLRAGPLRNREDAVDSLPTAFLAVEVAVRTENLPGTRRRAAGSTDSFGGMRLGIADHLGWAIAVTASGDHDVVGRRRIELIEPGLSAAPIHYESRRLDVAATAALVAKARASIARAASAALDELVTTLPEPVRSISLRTWPPNFPDDIAVQRRAPYEARADAVMYRQELAELADARGWEVQLYDAKAVVGQAARILGDRADEVLLGPRTTLGPPWAKDHRIALAATIVAAESAAQRGVTSK
jgi:hypothetical protein